MTEASSGRLETGQKSINALRTGSSITEDDIEVVNHDLRMFKIKIQSSTMRDKYFTVDMSTGICSCYVGNNGACCKHWAAIKILSIYLILIFCLLLHLRATGLKEFFQFFGCLKISKMAAKMAKNWKRSFFKKITYKCDTCI